MLDEKIIKAAEAKGLTIDEEDSGFSVKRESAQIRFLFNERKLMTFIEEYDEEKFSSELELKKQPKVEKNQSQTDKVVTKTIMEAQEIVINDIRMPFISMVTFMVKWAIASIPAFIILFVLFFVVFALLGGILSSLSR